MPFPPSFLDDLAARNPIEDVVGQYVNLSRKGGRLWGLCPFHGEKTASFSVVPDQGFYYCFGCHKGGGALNFVMDIENLSYPDAVRFLAKRAGMEVPEDEEYASRYRQQERLWALCAEAARFFHKELYGPGGVQALNYALGRGLSKGTLTRFGLGFAPNSWDALRNAMHAKGYTDDELVAADLATRSKKGGVYDRFRNRLMFPIIDVRGHVIAFGGRVMDDSTPKYLNSSDTLIFNKRKNLFAMNISRKSKEGKIILVEGYMDAVALHQYGFDYAVASLGTALTEDQVALLSKYTDQVILIYDGDDAGQNATRRAMPMLEKAGLKLRILKMRDAKDPDEFLKKFGADRFRMLLDESANQMEYQLSSLAAKYDLGEPDQKVEFLKDAAEILASVHSPVQQEVYGTRAAEKAGVSYDSMKLEIEKARKRLRSREKKQLEKTALSPAVTAQPQARNLRYDNMKSAMAEEQILSMVFKDPNLLSQIQVTPEEFSAPLLSRCFAAAKDRFSQGLQVSLGTLEGFAPEEVSHLAWVIQKYDAPISEQALSECAETIRTEHKAKNISTADDLMALQRSLQQKKGLRG